MRKIAFEPIVDEHSTTLILGTMPGDESLRRNQYYGHKSNQFWKILFALFNRPLSHSYIDRINLLLDNGIALWDVLHSCECEGSADSSIKKEETNNFKGFFEQYPNIKKVFFDSKKAQEFYIKHIGLDQDKEYFLLPSPSPANARISLSEKIEKWSIILEK